VPVKKIVTDIQKIRKTKLTNLKITLDKHDWRDGIIIRSPNWLGDAIMAIPAIKMLKTIVPRDCATVLLCPENIYPVFDSLNIIDHSFSFSALHGYWNCKEILRISHANFGVAVLFNSSFRDSFLFRFSMLFGKIYALSGRLNNIFLTNAFSFDKFDELKGYHHTSKYLSVSYAFGSDFWDGKFPMFEDIKEPEITSSEVLKVASSDKLLAIAPGAAYGPAKKWNFANFAKVAEYWINEKKGSVVILGNKVDHSIASNIENMIGSKGLFNLAGKTDLYDVIKILKNSKLCISNDSGIMHLASALGCPGIAVFGSTNPFLTSPLSEKWVSFYSDIDCSPCFKRDCPHKNYRCFEEIRPELIIDEIDRIFR